MIPWGRVLKDLALANAWPPDVVGRLTWYQAAIYAGARTPDDGPRRLTKEEALARGLVRLQRQKR